MAKKHYPNAPRGVNPALYQMSMEKRVEQELKAAFENGKKQGATSMAIVAAMMFPTFLTQCDNGHVDENFYKALKDAVMKSIPIEDDFGVILQRVRTELNLEASEIPSDDTLIEWDPSLAGHMPPASVSDNGLTVKIRKDGEK